MDKKLTFALTLGLTAFMSAHSIDTLKVIKSPKTSKLFFTSDAGVSGKISEALVAKGNYDDCSISLCTDPTAAAGSDEAKPFHMMHLSNEDNVIFVKKA